MPKPARVHYRADIDGLRAIAVSGVVAFHAFPAVAHGGFVGVDVFFVISGFLISTLILKDLDRGTFSFTDFYGRRIRRIFPALIVVLAFCLGLGWFVLIDDEYRMLGDHVGAAAAFVANFAFWSEAGYFDTAAELKPLLHLWSLGIEEQFYIFWPALLAITYRFGINALIVTGALGLISFWLNVSHVLVDRAWVFFLPQARLWELVVGGICAYLTLHHPGAPSEQRSRLRWALSPTQRAWIADAGSIAGLVLIGFGIFVLTKFDAFPGWWVTFPVLGTVLLILAGGDALVNRLLLSRRALVFIGLISFPLYLWHWPLLVFARIVRGWQPGVAARIVIVAASVVLAWLTYEFVEKRIRFRAKPAVTASLLLTIAFVGLCGYAVLTFDGLPARFEDLSKVSQVRREWEFTPRGGADLKPVTFSGSHFLRQTAHGRGQILFVGDSNAEQYWSRVDEMLKADPTIAQSVTFKTGGGCLPIPEVRSDAEAHCRELVSKALAYALQPEIDTVVFAADWWAYFEGASGYYLVDDGVKVRVKDPEGLTRALARFRSMLLTLHQSGKKVFVVLNIPIGQEVDPRNMLHRSLSGIRLQIGPPVRLSALRSRYGAFDEQLSAAALEAGANLVRPTDALCSEDACPIVDTRGEPLYMDATHLRPSYVRKHATFIDPVLNSRMDRLRTPIPINSR